MRFHPSLLFIPFCLIEPFLLCLLSGYFYVLSAWSYFRQRRAESGSSQLAGRVGGGGGGLRERPVLCWNHVHVLLDLSLSFFSPCCFLPFHTLNVSFADYTIMMMHINQDFHTISLCVCVLSQHPQCSDISFPEEGSGGKWTLHSEWRCQVSLSICLLVFFFPSLSDINTSPIVVLDLVYSHRK